MFLLPPSKRLDETEYVQVANALFEDDVALIEGVRTLAFSTSYTPPNPPPPTSKVTPQLVSSMKFIDEKYASLMADVRSSKACGIPLLGTFALYLADALTDTDQTLKVVMEFAVIKDKVKVGAKPSCDGAIAAIVSNTKIPILLFEYKPVVDTRWDHVDQHSLMETLIQGYYCLHQYKVHSVVHCLTDMFQWYYFKLERVRSSKLKVAWYHCISERNLNLPTHVDFLQPIVTDVLRALSLRSSSTSGYKTS